MAELCHKPDDIWKLEHKRSNVWFHFLENKSKKDNSSQAKCVYCGQILTIVLNYLNKFENFLVQNYLKIN